jgi:hypothetical protein
LCTFGTQVHEAPISQGGQKWIITSKGFHILSPAILDSSTWIYILLPMLNSTL